MNKYQKSAVIGWWRSGVTISEMYELLDYSVSKSAIKKHIELYSLEKVLEKR